MRATGHFSSQKKETQRFSGSCEPASGEELNRQALGSGSGTDGASLACPPLASCCVAQFLIGYRPVPSAARGLGSPVLGHTCIYQL